MEIKLILANDTPLVETKRILEDLKDRYSEYVIGTEITDKKKYKVQKTKKDPLIDYMKGSSKGDLNGLF